MKQQEGVRNLHWQVMAVMVLMSHLRCARHALSWLQQKVEHDA
jgi:hypothetical protein